MPAISHVDCPLLEPFKVYSIFCISAAILMYSPTPQSAAIGHRPLRRCLSGMSSFYMKRFALVGNVFL